MNDIPVLIAGGGPVGMTLALELGRRGVPCLLVEESDRSPTVPRASSLSARSMEHFRKCREDSGGFHRTQGAAEGRRSPLCCSGRTAPSRTDPGTAGPVHRLARRRDPRGSGGTDRSGAGREPGAEYATGGLTRRSTGPRPLSYPRARRSRRDSGSARRKAWSSAAPAYLPACTRHLVPEARSVSDSPPLDFAANAPGIRVPLLGKAVAVRFVVEVSPVPPLGGHGLVDERRRDRVRSLWSS